MLRANPGWKQEPEKEFNLSLNTIVNIEHSLRSSLSHCLFLGSTPLLQPTNLHYGWFRCLQLSATQNGLLKQDLVASRAFIILSRVKGNYNMLYLTESRLEHSNRPTPVDQYKLLYNFKKYSTFLLSELS